MTLLNLFTKGNGGNVFENLLINKDVLFGAQVEDFRPIVKALPVNKQTPASDIMSNPFFSILPMFLGSCIGLVLVAIESTVYYLIYLIFALCGLWKS